MKLSAFKSMLRELIREEVQRAVKNELKVLTEQKAPPKQIQQKTKPSYIPQKTAPLVTLDEPFGMSSSNPIASLLQETAKNMTGFDQEMEEANPDFPMGSAGTDAFVKDYSEILRKSQGIR